MDNPSTSQQQFVVFIFSIWPFLKFIEDMFLHVFKQQQKQLWGIVQKSGGHDIFWIVAVNATHH